MKSETPSLNDLTGSDEYAQSRLRVPSANSTTRWILASLVAIFLIVFASRVVRLPSLNMDPDEVWSVWQTLGTPQQIVSWTPYDWSPVFYLIVGGWQKLAGINLFILRLLPIFSFLIGLAILYRIAKTMYSS